MSLLSIISCDIDDNCIEGQGTVIITTQSFPSFSGISLNAAADKVTINQGAEHEIIVMEFLRLFSLSCMHSPH